MRQIGQLNEEIKEAEFLRQYFRRYQDILSSEHVYDSIVAMKDIAVECNSAGKKVILAGNGASAAIAGHCALDFTKQAGIRALSFNEPSLITAFANDYGYEYWVAKAIQFHADAGDAAVLISSSGKSLNMIHAARYAKEKNMKIITFTGFSPDNPLKQMGDLNFWVDSRAYNIIECTHMIWLTTVIDLIIGKAEYSVS